MLWYIKLTNARYIQFKVGYFFWNAQAKDRTQENLRLDIYLSRKGWGKKENSRLYLSMWIWSDLHRGLWEAEGKWEGKKGGKKKKRRLWHTGREDWESEKETKSSSWPTGWVPGILNLDSLLTHQVATNKWFHLYVSGSHKQGNIYLLVSWNVVKIINKCLESPLKMKGQIHRNGWEGIELTCSFLLSKSSLDFQKAHQKMPTYICYCCLLSPLLIFTYDYTCI